MRQYILKRTDDPEAATLRATMETVHERLKKAREKRYATAADFARAHDLSEATYRSHENGTRGLKPSIARRYAKALGVNWGWLLTGVGEAGENGKPMNMEKESLPSDVNMAKIKPAGLGAKDLPVYASAEGGPSGMTLVSDAIDWVARPEEVANVRGAFAVYVIGDSMEPAYWQGDMIYVNPSKPVYRGADVLLTRQIDGEMAALVKMLVRWTDKVWVVRQWNPKKEFELSREDWPLAQVITGKRNR